MMTLMLLIFLVGYAMIALEHPLKMNKAGTALLLGSVLWVIYAFAAPGLIPEASGETFKAFLTQNPELGQLPYAEQCLQFVTSYQIPHSLGEICSTLIFLIGAMTIVELIDAHGGFDFITRFVTAREKRRLLSMVALVTFFMSAVLDNLTTTIVMVMLIRKLVDDTHDRLIFGSMIVIAANSGGAWSPIGDVTTIMLWVQGNITTGATIPNLILPSLVSALLPLLILGRGLRGEVTPPAPSAIQDADDLTRQLSDREKLSILILGVVCLLAVPIFKTITHLPPFMGILLGVGVLWLYTEMMYAHLHVPEEKKLRLSKVVHRIDGSTLLFFLGILLAVDVLRYGGLLSTFALWLDQSVGDVYVVDLIIGTLSAVVDNVPLVAGAIGMYPIADEAMIASAADPAYLANFAQDGVFWQFLAYCAGVGGSMLIIGSAAGVVVMGLERISFGWYLKHVSLAAALGYLAGALVYIIQRLLF